MRRSAPSAPRWLRRVIPAGAARWRLRTGSKVGSRIVNSTKPIQTDGGAQRQCQSRQQGQHAGRCGQRAPQIVEHLPAADRRDGARASDPRRRVGPRPTVHGSNCQSPRAQRWWRARGDVVAGGKLLDDLDVGGETGARKDALEQIVAEQRGVRHAAGERGLEGVDVVDALAGIGAFAEQILVHVGDGGGVRVDAARAGEHALEQRTLAADRQ